MSPLLLSFVVLLQAQTAAQATSQSSAQIAAGSASLEGVVTRSGTTETVARARVLVTSADGAETPATLTRTNDSGRFVVPGLPAGQYRVVVERDGYMRSMTPVAVTGKTPTTTTILLTPTAVITGRVVDAQGNPASRAFVRAVRGSQIYEGQTNDLGEYRIFDLPPGTYVVNASPYLAPRIEGTTLIRPSPPSPYAPGEGAALLPLTRMVQAGDYIDPMALTREAYVPMYYPGTTDVSGATSLELSAGATLTGIDMTVVKAPAPAPAAASAPAPSASR